MVLGPASSERDGHNLVNVPTTVNTGCTELDLVWGKFAAEIVGRPGVLIPDTEDDLNWHAFLGHSIDMQGFIVGCACYTRPPHGGDQRAGRPERLALNDPFRAEGPRRTSRRFLSGRS